MMQHKAKLVGVGEAAAMDATVMEAVVMVVGAEEVASMDSTVTEMGPTVANKDATMDIMKVAQEHSIYIQNEANCR